MMKPSAKYYASDAQIGFLKLLLNQAFANRYETKTCLDPRHLDGITRTEASAAISQLKTAKEKGWKS